MTDKQLKELFREMTSIANNQSLVEAEEEDTNLPTTSKTKRVPVNYGIPEKREWVVTKMLKGKDRGIEIVIIAGRMKDQEDKQVINGYIRLMDVVPDKPMGKAQFLKAIDKFLVASTLFNFMKKILTIKK